MKPDSMPRAHARDALHQLVVFCLAHDPRTLAAPVENIAATRDKIAMLQRWFARYEKALPPEVQ